MMDGSRDQMWSSCLPSHSSPGVISSRLVWEYAIQTWFMLPSIPSCMQFYSVVRSEKNYDVFWKVLIVASICRLQYLTAESGCVIGVGCC